MTSPMLKRIRRNESVAEVKSILGDALRLVVLGLAAFWLLFALGCGGGDPWQAPPSDCDFTTEALVCVRGVNALPDSPAKAAITRDRIDAILRGTADFYDLPIAALASWDLVFVDAPFTCGDDVNAVAGCAEFGSRVITVGVFMPQSPCLPLFVPIVHEALHVLTGDRGHTGATWEALNAARFEIARADPLCTVEP